MPIGIIRNPSKFNFNEQLLGDLIAFKAITAGSSDIQLAAGFLFPKEDPAKLQ
jgi:hypothetical protein